MRCVQGVNGTAAALCLAWVGLLVGCDQFAVVGIDESRKDGGTTPPARVPQDAAAPTLDAASPIEPDAMITDPTTADASTGLDAGDATTECPLPDGGIQVCNPLMNRICTASVVDECCAAELLQRCAVDRFALHAGFCITQSLPISGLGEPCIYSGGTDSCQATTSCYKGICRETCLCDSDCTTGCCRDAIESTGFRLCGPC